MCRDMEVCWHAVGAEMRRNGGMETGCRRADVGGGMEAWRRGVLEARRKRRDVEGQRYGDVELGRHAAGMGTWRHVEV